MVVARYRPDHDVTFDLAHGLVHLEGASARVLVPASALAALFGTADLNAVAGFGKALGRAMGLRLAKRLSSVSSSDEGDRGARAASLETMVDHLGAELALAGLGSLALERWGRALIVVVDHCPLESDGDRLLEAVIAEAVGLAAGRQVSAVLLARDGARARFLLTNSAAADQVRAWLRDGIEWGDTLGRLHEPVTPRSQAFEP